MFDFNLKGLKLYFIIVSIITIATASKVVYQKFNEYAGFEKEQVKIAYNSIFYEDGYMNSTEQPWCSDSQTLTDITAHRLMRCTKLRNISLKEAPVGQEDDPTQSYLVFMEKYGNGCRHYFKSESPTSMFAFIECDIRLNKIPLEKLERDWAYFFEINYSQEYIMTDTEYEALDINTATGGTLDDGKLRIRFEK